jgi:plasmid stabilization system protein ParE
MAAAVWTRSARAEVEELLQYIRDHGGRPETARKLGKQIRELTDRAAQPGFPKLRMERSPEGWHYVRFKRWLIFYQSHPAGIEVMRVVDATRDLPSILETPPNQ